MKTVSVAASTLITFFNIKEKNIEVHLKLAREIFPSSFILYHFNHNKKLTPIVLLCKRALIYISNECIIMNNLMLADDFCYTHFRIVLEKSCFYNIIDCFF